MKNRRNCTKIQPPKTMVNMNKHIQFLIKEGWEQERAFDFQTFVYKNSKTIHGQRKLIDTKELESLRERFEEINTP